MEEEHFHPDADFVRYRMLTDEELSHFDQEFKQFLIVNQVHTEEWEQLNESDPDKARALVGIFSSQVLQRVYEKMEYLEVRTLDSLFVFRYMKAAVHLILLQLQEEGTEGASFDTEESIKHTLIEHAEQIRFFKTQKTYKKTREMEIHELVQQGAIPSNESFWQQLDKLTQDE